MIGADRSEPSVPGRDDWIYRLGLLVLALLCALAWALSHAYRGVFHDAGLYLLQGLAHANSASLGQDVFLKWGSQDRYGLFGPLLGAVLPLFGSAEAAAAALTLAFQLGLFAAVCYLGRSLMPRLSTLLGLTAFIALPAEYGADQVFACIEPYLSPRMAGEALALAGLAGTIRARPWIAGCCFAAAMLIHPIMAAAGVVAAFLYSVAMPRPRIGLPLAAGATVLLLGAALLMPGDNGGRLDEHWLSLVAQRSPYLFLSGWGLGDWSRLAVTAATLEIGARTFADGSCRRLCRAALWTLAAGLALSFVGGDLLRSILLVRLQPWRWQWLSTIVAALFLPSLLRARWRSETRGVALLLAAAWLLDGASAIGVALLAAAAAALLRRLKAGQRRLIALGCWAVLVVALFARIASDLQFLEAYYVDVRLPPWLRRAVSLVHDGALPIAAALLAVHLTQAPPPAARALLRTPRARGAALGAMAVLLAGSAAAILPYTLSQWMYRGFPAQRAAELAAWRRIIPPGAQVFWPETPPAAWLLLDRPHYLSALQTSGLVFSRAAALELERRARALQSVIPGANFLSWNGAALTLAPQPDQLERVCGLKAFDFLVTPARLGMATAAEIPGSRGLRLYRCR